MDTPFVVQVGQRYGTITVLYRKNVDKHGRAWWQCKCDCGVVMPLMRHNIEHAVHGATCRSCRSRLYGFSGQRKGGHSSATRHRIRKLNKPSPD